MFYCNEYICKVFTEYTTLPCINHLSMPLFLGSYMLNFNCDYIEDR